MTCQTRRRKYCSGLSEPHLFPCHRFHVSVNVTRFKAIEVVVGPIACVSHRHVRAKSSLKFSLTTPAAFESSTTQPMSSQLPDIPGNISGVTYGATGVVAAILVFVKLARPSKVSKVTRLIFSLIFASVVSLMQSPQLDQAAGLAPGGPV